MLTKKGLDLLKYVNDPKNKARFKKINKEIENQELEEEAKKLWERSQKYQQDKKTRKEMVGFTLLFIFLGFIVWLTV